MGTASNLLPDWDEARDYADMDPVTHVDPKVRDLRERIRVLKGRPRYRGTTRLYDKRTRRLLPPIPTHLVDPMLQLEAARRSARMGPDSAVRYGALRQRIVSPVRLPA